MRAALGQSKFQPDGDNELIAITKPNTARDTDLAQDHVLVKDQMKWECLAKRKRTDLVFERQHLIQVDLVGNRLRHGDRFHLFDYFELHVVTVVAFLLDDIHLHILSVKFVGHGLKEEQQCD